MYGKQEFIETAVKRGYASRHHVQMWIKDHEKEEYDEEDLIEVYRFENRQPFRSEPVRLVCEDEEELKQMTRDSWL